jgi:hypothetical protein
LYYYGARYYDPAIGRYISPDTFVQDFTNTQSFNRYTYVYNNPLKYTDPSGHFAWFAVFAVVRVALVVYNVVTTPPNVVTAVKDPTPENIFWAGIGFIDPSPGNNASGLAKEGVQNLTEGAFKQADNAIEQATKNAPDLPISKQTTWPNTPDEMDEFLGMPGTKIPDGPTTPGRDKVQWQTSDDVTITFEQHPYHTDAPDYHTGLTCPH